MTIVLQTYAKIMNTENINCFFESITTFTIERMQVQHRTAIPSAGLA